MKLKLLCFVFFICVSYSCSDDDTDIGIDENDPNQIEEPISLLAESYITEIINVMEENSIFKNDINWTNFRNTVFSRISGAQTLQDTYPGIRQALRLLGDNHSSFTTTEGIFLFEGEIVCSSQTFPAVQTPDNIGYISIPSFSEGSVTDPVSITFAQNIQNQIEAQDSNEIDGWIVDLRNNGGGNMWPMLAGVGPLLGNGIAGYFTSPDGTQSSWSYNNGASISNGFTFTQVPNPYVLINQNPKVAVLQNRGVASSGEAIAVSFIGRENSRSFGVNTCGLSTGNAGFTISNNSFLNLTVSTFTDRNGTLYGNFISPDEVVSDAEIIDVAIQWILN